MAAPAIIAFNRLSWGATTVWTPSSAVNSGPTSGEGGFSYRDTANTLNTGSLGQVRVTFTNPAGSGIGVTMDHCSIGVASTAPNTAATPVQLLFSGASGYSLPSANTSAVSDWVNLSFLSSDTLLVVQDANAGNSGVFFGAITNGDDWKKAATASYNQATVVGFSSSAGLTRMMTLIETQAGGATTPARNILMNGM